MSRSLLSVGLACLLGLAAAGCGLKGDLYLEDEPPVEEAVQEAAQETGQAPAE